MIKLMEHGGYDRSTEDAYSFMAPDLTLTFVGDSFCPTLSFICDFWIRIAFNTLLTSLFDIHCTGLWVREMANIPKLISFETHEGIKSQRNKWANTDPWIYRRWEQVPRRSKHPLSTGHTRCEPSFMIMNAELSPVKVSVSSTV
jgi:hypothetical protein